MSLIKPLKGRNNIPPGTFGTLIDLTDAYYHILIHPEHRKWRMFR